MSDAETAEARRGIETLLSGCVPDSSDAERLRAALEAIDRLARNLDEARKTWTDEHGIAWERPTAWAYAKARKALDAAKLDRESWEGTRVRLFAKAVADARAGGWREFADRFVEVAGMNTCDDGTRFYALGSDRFVRLRDRVARPGAGPEEKRRVLCAAIQVGNLLCVAKRHSDIIRSVPEGHRVRQEDQGFLTTDGLFVDRATATKVAMDAGQISALPPGCQLTVEDIEAANSGAAVAGRPETTPADFEQRCTQLIADEQAKVSPDNALIAVLCDAVRVNRIRVALEDDTLFQDLGDGCDDGGVDSYRARLKGLEPG